MSEFPSLAEVLTVHRYRIFPGQCACQERGEFMREDVHREHQADAWREACTIRTVEELDALPCLATVLDADGALLRRDPFTTDLKNTIHPWFPLDQYCAMDRDFGLESIDVTLPALLIWHPDWERP